MATDTSQVVYGCPFCDVYFREENKCRSHISGSRSGGHSGKNGHDLDRPLDILQPEFESFDFDDWSAQVEVWAEDNKFEGSEEKVVVEGNLRAEGIDLPKPYVAFELERLGYTPVDTRGRKLPERSSWNDVPDKAQELLLVRAYHPDLSTRELFEQGLSPYASKGTTYNNIVRFGWVLSHPDTDTPIEPGTSSSGEENGSVKTEGGTEDMMSRFKSAVESSESDSTAETDQGEGEEPGEAADSPPEPQGSHGKDGLPPESGEKTDQRPKREVESSRRPDRDEKGTADDGSQSEPVPQDAAEAAILADGTTALLESDLAFEAIAALVKTGRYEEARTVFRRACGEAYDVRWENDD